jgi:hypothetical protein
MTPFEELTFEYTTEITNSCHWKLVINTEGLHFKLFDYPAPANPTLMWEIGDHIVSDFVIVQPYGIDYGTQTFRDGVYIRFLSFENFLHRPDFGTSIFTPDIKQGIADYLANV